MADYTSASDVESQRLQIQRLVDNVHVAMPVKVLEFMADGTPKVNVQPLTQLKVTLGDEVKFVSFPKLCNVPVVIPYAQTAGLLITLPIKSGDTGLLVIADRGIDTFLKGQGEETPPPFSGDATVATPRAHALNDGIFIPGLCIDAMTVDAYSLENIEIRDKQRKHYISLGPKGIEISDSKAVWKMQDGKLTVNAPNGIDETSESPVSRVTSACHTLKGSNIDIGCGDGHVNRMHGRFEIGDAGTANIIHGDVTMPEGTVTDKDGVNLNTHTHGGIEPGGGSTAEPDK